MEVSRSTEIKVGIVTLAALLLALGGFMVGKGISFSPNEKIVMFRLPTSGGLDNSSPIVVNGVTRGKVKEIKNENGSVLVFASVNDVSDLHADATARVSILEITGGKKVEIHPGTDAAPLDLSKEIPGVVAADIGSLVGMLGDAGDDAKRVLRRVDTITAALTALLSDGTVIANVKTMADDGAVALHNARLLLEDNRADLNVAVKNLRMISEDVRRIIDKNDPKLTALLDKLDRTISSADGTIARADGAIIKADTLLKNVNDVIVSVKTNDGLVHRILYDTVFANRLDTTIYSLRKFINGARANGVNVNVGIGHK
ncbi:MAG: MCE family protein [Bacteroidetes bacterium]|nr:MCE family protein [Bacteroidota bacterium]